MLSFDWPWLFLLLPLPLLSYWLFPTAELGSTALRVPFFALLNKPSQNNAVTATTKTPRLLLLSIIWVLLVLAASGPKWLGDPIQLPSSGRDLLLAVDISESMEIADMRIGNDTVDRLVAVKVVLREFIQRRVGDRLGLILFGSQAYLQSPLTFDQTTVEKFLLESQIGFAGGRTAIGDAIGLSVKRLRKRPGERHVLILLTDGANTAGEIEPSVAAELAKSEGIIIYTIGIGADEMLQRSLFGSRRVNPSVDLDEETLRNIANLTGGQYFRARSPEELSKIYALLDTLEPVEESKESFRPSSSLFMWPLGMGFILSLIAALNGLRR